MRRHLPDIQIAGLLLLLPLLMFWAQTVGGATLLPVENLYQYEPYATYRDVVSAPAVPHNHLVSDLILQNYQWKAFIRQSISQGEIPLWNPYQFGGIPFFAAGQQSTLYPLSIIYYALPLTAAYGWFTVIQLWLAGLFMYAFVRGLGIGRFGAAVSGVSYQLAAFFVISAVFPMIIASAAWLPLLLLMTEFTIRQRPLFGRPSSVPWVVVGAAALGSNILAGHVEITYYTLLITAYYAAARLLVEWWQRRADLRRVVSRGIWLALMVALGLGLGAVQFIPLYEFASVNWRAERTSLETVLSYAHPPRDVLQFVLPNFYGSPAHHTWFDWFTLQMQPVTVNAFGQPITNTEWGIKNYVEGALYVGVLPLLLAFVGLLTGWRKRAETLIFALLGLLALTFMFGLPTYAALYLLPGINQLNSPFRWIFALTLSVAVLAGFGAEALAQRRYPRWLRALPLIAGLLVLAGLLLSRLLYPQIEPVIVSLLDSMVTASGEPAATRFAGPAMFFSYQFTNVLVLGLVLAGGGLALLWRGRGWQTLLIVVIAADLMIASWGFNPASDPALLDFTPPAIEWLQGQEGRYTTLDDPSQRPLFNANLGWSFGLRDIRGYESIIPADYVATLRELAPQVQLDFNRVAPLYTVYPAGIDFDYATALASPLMNWLSVAHVVTHKSTTLPTDLTGGANPAFTLAYEDEAVRIWRNNEALPLAYTVPGEALTAPPAEPVAAEIISDSGREKFIRVSLAEPGWLIVSENYMPGWRAFTVPADPDTDETPLNVQRVYANLQGVYVPAAGDYTLRVVYSPVSFQLGLFTTFISGVLLVFMGGIWLWRLFIAPQADDDTTVSRVARNSAAPIILNLFNRGIDFGFAFIMLRILGPEDAGIYYYAAFIFGWFDIFTNFGLDLYLTRQVARDRTQAARYFYSTSALRLLLTLVGLVLLYAFLMARQGIGDAPLTAEAVGAIVLLYIGLFPGSLSKGLTSLFYAFERAEYPAAITTLSTISKAMLGIAALVLGYGVIGLAGASIITNVVTLGVLAYGARALMGRYQQPDPALMTEMARESWPLMVNHFLQTIFFQIDIVIIEAIHGARMVGLYSVAYKWVAALNVIPAFFTMAMLPLMSRQAQEDREALKRTYVLAIKLLTMVALPVAVLFTFLAYVLTFILGGDQYLPDGAIATQLMIWSIPFGWINSLTQYVLIALDLQRRITLAFVLAVSFNIISNLILIPQYGYQAAAITTILSEIMLLLPFGLLLTGAVGRLPWVDMVWRQVVAAGVMFGLMALLWPVQSLLALIAGCVVYPVLLLALRPLTAAEIERLQPLIPGRFRKVTTAIVRVR